MTTQHTPGPWNYSHDSHAFVILADGFVVADVFHEEEEGYRSGPFTPEEAQANASLIAAAPELLAVLQNLSNQLIRTEEYDGLSNAVKSALIESEAAIAKATR